MLKNVLVAVLFAKVGRGDPQSPAPLLFIFSMGLSYSPCCDSWVHNWLSTVRCTAPYPLIKKETPSSVCASGL